VTRKKGGKRSGAADLLLTPLIDMFVILVVFLIMNFSATGEIDGAVMQLPRARTTTMLERAPVIQVTPGTIAAASPNDDATAALARSTTAARSRPIRAGSCKPAFGPSRSPPPRRARLYVVNQGSNNLLAIDAFTGSSTVVVATWPVPARLFTTIAWDQDGVFDGNLYMGDQGSDGDADSRIFRVAPTRQATVVAEAPGEGMDDLYALAFIPTSTVYTPGLYVSGDTDGAGVDWGRIDAAGSETAFSSVSGIEGAVFDRSGLYGRRLIASRPLGGGYDGDGSLTVIEPNGLAGRVIANGLGGVHAVLLSPGGAFGVNLYAADWSGGRLIRVSPAGVSDVVASALALTNYDGNILAFSPDGNVMYVADRSANRVVCIEPL